MLEVYRACRCMSAYRHAHRHRHFKPKVVETKETKVLLDIPFHLTFPLPISPLPIISLLFSLFIVFIPKSHHKTIVHLSWRKALDEMEALRLQQTRKLPDYLLVKQHVGANGFILTNIYQLHTIKLLKSSFS